MNFASHYFTRYKALEPFFCDSPDNDLGMVVIIPCFDEAFIFNTLDSLEETDAVSSTIEVIVNVNSGEETPAEVVMRNRAIFNELKQKAESGCYKKFRLLPIIVEGTIRKKAGVGFARKVAMDEAVRRFAAIDKPNGIIVSLDADTLVSKDYFREIEKASEKKIARCFTFQFKHDFNIDVYPEVVINACKMYEIYLRYYRLALKTFEFPFAIHTIGSCFAICAEAYVKLGGMTSRQGGEDFYFLQKAVKMHPVYEVNKQIVFPSPRISNRVPFGTGPSIRNIVENGEYKVYNFSLFRLLKTFYCLFPAMESKDMRNEIPPEIMSHIGNKAFDELLAECRKYSSSSQAFVKRMYDNFDAFFIVKFLNTFDKDSAYPSIDVVEAGRVILNCYGVNTTGDMTFEELYEEVVSLDVKVDISLK